MARCRFPQMTPKYCSDFLNFLLVSWIGNSTSTKQRKNQSDGRRHFSTMPKSDGVTIKEERKKRKGKRWREEKKVVAIPYFFPRDLPPLMLYMFACILRMDGEDSKILPLLLDFVTCSIGPVALPHNQSFMGFILTIEPYK